LYSNPDRRPVREAYISPDSTPDRPRYTPPLRELPLNRALRLNKIIRFSLALRHPSENLIFKKAPLISNISLKITTFFKNHHQRRQEIQNEIEERRRLKLRELRNRRGSSTHYNIPEETVRRGGSL